MVETVEPDPSEAPRVREQLRRDGFAVVPGVLDAAAVADVGRAAQALLDAAPVEHFDAHRTTGSMLSVAGHDAFSGLVMNQRTVSLLRALGYGHVAWSAGYVISKPAGAPRLFWHQDWLYWDHPVSWEDTPHQLFAMYYLVDTQRNNACLRVIPGSHRQHLPAHDHLLRAHSEDVLAGSNLSHPTFGDLPGEIDVPIRAGDLLLGDSRLLHSAHANDSPERRTLITLWYHPAYEHLPGGIRASLVALNAARAAQAPPVWSRALGDLALPPEARGEPYPINREPHFPPSIGAAGGQPGAG